MCVYKIWIVFPYDIKKQTYLVLIYQLKADVSDVSGRKLEYPVKIS